MKTNVDKRVNKIVRKINRELKADVFGDRFWIRQFQKAKNDEGMQYYLYEMRDRLEPNRNSLIAEGWIWGESQFFASTIYEAINDFIVKSDFWSKHNGSSYNQKVDDYAQDFYHYHSKRF